MRLLNSKVSDIQHNSCSNQNSTTCSCFDCEYETKSREELRQHRDNMHVKYFTCKDCDFKSTDSTVVKEHKVKNHQVSKIMCDKCSFETNHQAQLETHKKNQHKEPAFPCDSCSYKANHSRDLQRHKNTMHGKSFTCKTCANESADLYSLSAHIREEHRSTRTFYASTTEKNRRPASMKQRVSSATFTSPRAASTSPPTSQTPGKFQCQGECSTINDDIEYQLHMTFYHSEPQQ